MDRTVDGFPESRMLSSIGLLQPEQIRAGRIQLGLDEKAFAAQLGVSEESVLRWETGAVAQARAADREIRLFFEFPSVRSALCRLERGDPIGETVRVAERT